MSGPERSERLYQRVTSLMSEQRWAEVISALEGESSLVGSEFRLAWNLGWAYFKHGDAAKACEHLEQATALEPENPVGQWALGTALKEIGRSQEAERSLLRALELKESTLPRLTLALLYLEQGRAEEAERIHREGLERRPDSSERWAAYADFLSDVGRESEAEEAKRRSEELETGTI